MAGAVSSDASDYVDVEDTVMTGEAVALELRPTGFALAAAGAAIDWLVYFGGGLLFITFAVVVPLGSSSLGQDSATMSAFVSASLVLVLIVIPDRRRAAHARQVPRPAGRRVHGSCGTTAARSGFGTPSSATSSHCSRSTSPSAAWLPSSACSTESRSGSATFSRAPTASTSGCARIDRARIRCAARAAGVGRSPPTSRASRTGWHSA